MNPRVNCIGLSLDDSDGCIQILVGSTAFYLHGSPEAMRAFAEKIVEKAEHLNRELLERELIDIPQ